VFEIADYIWSIGSDRLVQAFTTLPDIHSWVVCLLLFVGYGAIALPIGFLGHLLRIEWVSSWATILMTTVVTLIFPSLVEEIVFRVLLLPHPIEHPAPKTIIVWSIVSLILFVIAHPLNAWLVMKSRRSTFWDPWFLVLATLLGGICTLSYIQSGSLWLPVMLHWVIVLMWLLCLGGDRRMSSHPSLYGDALGIQRSLSEDIRTSGF
jgi:predicted Abi (CAAX) family protease